MIYVITNITHTSDDQHRRGHRHREFRKGRVQIGPRNILEGRSATFSEDMYEAYKPRIEHYLTIGMIKVVRMGEYGDAEGQEILPENVEAQEDAPADVVASEDAPIADVQAAVSEELEPTVVADPAPETVESGAAPEDAPVEQPAKRKGRPPKEK